jgi:hypothetical protein
MSETKIGISNRNGFRALGLMAEQQFRRALAIS